MSKRDYSSRVPGVGTAVHLGVVAHPRADGTLFVGGLIDPPGSVLIVPLDGEQVLMLRQYRLALDEWILELPAGTREKDEPWLDCAQRELREETGYQAAGWTELGRVWPAPGLTNELMAVYLARDLSPAPLPGDDDEEIEVRPMMLDEVLAMALDGRMGDAKSVVGVLRVAAHLSRLPAGQGNNER